MKETIFTIIGLLIGVLILITGLYYLFKEKDDAESRKIYGIATAVGVIIVAGLILKIILAGI